MSELPYHVEVEETEDGSMTLYVPELNEHYHSVHGARTESEYIFIEHALEARLKLNNPKTEYSVVEIGFGTGLNALLTFLYLSRLSDCPHITYHTYEKFPIDAELTPKLFKGVLTDDELLVCTQLFTATWNEAVDLSPFFTLVKHHSDATKADIPPYDVLYMDAFSPENAPDLWSDSFLTKLSLSALPSATYSTYCAKGAIRRKLQDLGWKTVRTPGPPGGKREILTAYRSDEKNQTIL